MRRIKRLDLWGFVIAFSVFIFDYSIFFYGSYRRISWIVLFGVLLAINFRKRTDFFSRKYTLFLLSIYLLIAIQGVLFGGFTLAGLYKPIWIFLTPLLVITLLRTNYLKYTFKAIYNLSVISTIIYVLHAFIPPISRFIDSLLLLFAPFSGNKEPTSIIIYSAPAYYEDFPIPRNSGFTHEPGMFSIIILLGIIINTILTKNAFNRKNSFLVLILLTTFSTTGYISLFIYYGYYLLRSKIHFSLKIVIVPAFLVFSYFTYFETGFLGGKVEESISSDAIAIQSGDKMQRGRFYAFNKSIEVFLKHPITGRGILSATESDIIEKKASFGYGVAGLLANYGLFFSIFYMFFFYKGMEKIVKNAGLKKMDAIISFLVINLALLTQPFFLSIAFVAFFTIGFMYKPTSVLH